MKRLFKCQTAPQDNLTVEAVPQWREVWIYANGDTDAGIMVTPKRARKIARAIKRAAKEIERGA